MWIRFLSIFFILIRFGSGMITEKEITRIYREALKNYEKRSVPIRDGKPVEVRMRISINNMVPRKKSPMHFHMDFYVTLFWEDYRLAFNHTENYTNHKNNVDYLPYDVHLSEKIWTPNLYLVESKFGWKNDVPQPNVMIYLYPNGTVGFNFRLNVGLYCAMQMRYFPFDKQHCQMTIETYSYNSGYVKLKWSIVEQVKKLHITDFAKVEIHKTEKPDVDYGHIGKWDQLILKLTFYRNSNLYLVRDFFPCFLIVSLSWINFWVTHRSTPARVALGITTVLTIVTMTNSVRSQAPSSGLFRCIDVYMLCCNLFVFAALGEAALVGMTAPSEKHANEKEKDEKEKAKEKTNKDKKKAQKVNDNPLSFDNPVFKRTESVVNNGNGIHSNHQNGDMTTKTKLRTRSIFRNSKNAPEKEAKPKKTFNPLLTNIKKVGPVYFYTQDVHIVDKISRVLFPVLFILFNVLFFFVIHMVNEDTTI
ncbi:gamma-aminobutyric acid receptor subunit beta-like [Clytia hemisphaerica]|uniref:Uncharacterized protein n=1 Tax=Clytia hemisphaerica TaxID=252671 RepID=A0A7M6DMW7_9CNID